MKSELSLPKKRTEITSSTNNLQIQPRGCLSTFVRSNSTPFCCAMATSVEWAQYDPMGTGQSQPKKLSQQDEFRLRYENIEKLLTEQNLNLRKQANFLTLQARNSLKRQKMQQEDIRKLQQQYQNTLKQLKYVTEENIEIKEYIERKIITLVSAMKRLSLESILNDIKQVIRELCEFFSINLELKPNRYESLQPECMSSQDLKENKARVDELSDKFEALLYEYKSSSKPELRKQCILIAKEIKELKQQLPINNQNEELPDLQKKEMTRKYSKENLKGSKDSKGSKVSNRIQPADGQPQFIPEIEGGKTHQKYVYPNDEEYLMRQTPKRKTMNQSKSTSYLTHLRADRDLQ